MPHFSRGDIVLVPFPFSAEEAYKVRPAVVLAPLPYFGGTDYLLCIITTQAVADPHKIDLAPVDVEGRLTESCFIRPTYTFSADEFFIRRRVAALKPEKLKAVIAALTQVLNTPEA